VHRVVPRGRSDSSASGPGTDSCRRGRARTPRWSASGTTSGPGGLVPLSDRPDGSRRTAERPSWPGRALGSHARRLRRSGRGGSGLPGRAGSLTGSEVKPGWLSI
jgi:hypothetical protein